MAQGKVVAALIARLAEQVSKELRGRVSDDLNVYAHYARETTPLEWISTGNYAINRILGGGIPVGRTVEIFGPYSGGKSALLYEVLAEVTQQEGAGLLIDSEATYDEHFGAAIGIKSDRLLYSRPDTVEDMFALAEKTIKGFRSKSKHALFCIGWDSLASSSTRYEMENPDKRDFTKAPLISAGMRRLTRLISKQRTAFIVVNQTREKIGVMFGNPETTPGGHAVPFHASIRIRVQHGSLYRGHPKNIKDGFEVIAVRLVVDCVKNKLAPPFRKCEAILSFENGLIKWAGLTELLAEDGLIKEDDKGIYGYKGMKFRPFELDAVLEKHPELLTARKGE